LRPLRERRCTVRRTQHVVSRGGEGHSHGLADTLVVVDHQHLVRRVHSSLAFAGMASGTALLRGRCAAATAGLAGSLRSTSAAACRRVSSPLPLPCRGIWRK
jgi:hypothetical protein